jgi:hypothetical protein
VTIDILQSLFGLAIHMLLIIPATLIFVVWYNGKLLYKLSCEKAEDPHFREFKENTRKYVHDHVNEDTWVLLCTWLSFLQIDTHPWLNRNESQGISTEKIFGGDYISQVFAESQRSRPKCAKKKKIRGLREVTVHRRQQKQKQP